MPKIVTQLVRTRRDTMSIRLRFCIDRARLRKNPLLDVVPMRNLLEKGHVILTSCREHVRRQATGMNQSVTSVTSEKLPCFAETTEAVDRDGQKRCIPRAEGVDKENLRR